MVVIQLSNSCNDVRFVLPKVGGEKVTQSFRNNEFGCQKAATP